MRIRKCASTLRGGHIVGCCMCLLLAGAASSALSDEGDGLAIPPGDQRSVSGLILIEVPTGPQGDKDKKVDGKVSHKGLGNVAVFVEETDVAIENKSPKNKPEMEIVFDGKEFAPKVSVLAGRDCFMVKNTALTPLMMKTSGAGVFTGEIVKWREVVRVQVDKKELWPVAFINEVGSRAGSWVVVTPNGCATVTDKDGRFVLNGVPRGKWTLRFWHPNVRFTSTLVRGRMKVDVGTKDVSLDSILLSTTDVVGSLEE